MGNRCRCARQTGYADEIGADRGQGKLWGLFVPKQLNEGFRKRVPPAGRGMIPLHPHSAMKVGGLYKVFPREA